MHFVQALAMAAVAVALPTDMEVSKRQLFGRTGITENEFSRSRSCGDVIFVWARGSTEIGNMGTIIGQPLGDELRKEFGDGLQIEGVDYAALLSTNFLPGGTDAIAENEMKGILNDIHDRCPQSIIICGGYSQGAAVNHRAIEDLSSAVKDQIAGVVTFGDTQKRKDNERIPGFPKNKLKIFCGSALAPDTVCQGVLTAAVLLPHLSYGSDAEEAAEFLIGKVNEARRG